MVYLFNKIDILNLIQKGKMKKTSCEGGFDDIGEGVKANCLKLDLQENKK